MLDGHLMWVLECFTTLSSFRSWGEGIPDPISMSDILTYMSELGIRKTHERLGLLGLISACDVAFIDHFATKQSERIKATKKKGKR